MARKDISASWDRNNRNAINDNFIELYDEYIKAGLNAREARQMALQAVNMSDQAKIDSQQAKSDAEAALRYNVGKYLEPINTYSEIGTTYPNPTENDRVFVRDTGKVYILQNGTWQEFSEITAGPVNEVDQRLTADLSSRALNVQKFSNIQEAIDAAPIGSEIIFPSGAYNFDSVKITKPITIDFKNSYVESSVINKNIFEIVGTESENKYALSSPLKRGDDTITLTSNPTDISAGDIIVVRDDAVRATDGKSDMNVETHEVERVIENKIVLKDSIRWKKEISAVSNVYKIDVVEGVTLKNVTFGMKEGSTFGSPVFADMTRFLRLVSVKTRNTSGSSAFITRSIDFYASDFDFKNPQVTGSGQGYGLQLFGGVSRFIIENGKGSRMRHTIDLHSSYRGVIQHVDTSRDTSSSFVLSHNGWGGDVTCFDCEVVNGTQYGFNISAQGTQNPYEHTHHNINLLNCRVHLAEDASMAQYAINFRVPVMESLIRDSTLKYGTGEMSGSNTGGISLLSVDNDLIIENPRIENFYFSIRAESLDGVHQTKTLFKTKIKNLYAKNCVSVVSSTYGENRNLSINGLTAEKVSSSVIRLVSGTIQELEISNVNVINSPGVLMFNAQPPTTTTARGHIGDFVVAENGVQPLTVTEGKKLTLNEMLLARKGVLPISSNAAVTLAGYPLQNGIVEGQRINLLNIGTHNITVPNSSLLALRGSQARTLEPRMSVELTWIYGAWREVN